MSVTTTPKYKTYTIEEYAHYVLDDPRIQDMTSRFAKYQKAADKVIDAFEGLVDSGVLVFDDAEELERARAFNASTEICKDVELERLLATLHPDIGWIDPELSFDEIAARDASQPHPNKTDVPVIVFYEFATKEEFKDYLYKGSLELLSGAYFAKDIDLAQQKYLVFATFLWAYMDVKIPEGGGDQYYNYAECCPTVEEPDALNASLSLRNNRHYNQVVVDGDASPQSLRQISHTAVRLDFLRAFKDYIHFDLWHEDDYDKKKKRGTIMRLALDIPITGNVVIQTCGNKGDKCNTMSRINEESFERLSKEYLTPDTELRKLGTFLRCGRCTKLAYFMVTRNSMNQYYCDLRCFNRCKK